MSKLKIGFVAFLRNESERASLLSGERRYVCLRQVDIRVMLHLHLGAGCVFYILNRYFIIVTARPPSRRSRTTKIAPVLRHFASEAHSLTKLEEREIAVTLIMHKFTTKIDSIASKKIQTENVPHSM